MNIIGIRFSENLKHLFYAKKHRIEAFSIAECISALLIVTISFGAGISIFGQVNRDSVEKDNLQIGVILDGLMIDTKINKSFSDDSFIIDGMKIIKKVETYNTQNNLLKISLTALSLNNNMEVYKISEVVYH
jgi:hypothetical protein